ncbi:protein ALP1-like [Rutidosis leptorrhynchoides]|uniref:protein ALP1-like n=1 Tax=Rutidosis leptorrhynchoides TaxID=125765 RepID=UPI003A9989ED
MDFLALSIDLLFDSTSSEEEEEIQPRTRFQRQPRCFLNRDREAADQLLWNDYFCENPMFSNDIFKRRFRMRKVLFLRIREGILQHSFTPNAPDHFTFFQQCPDALGRLGFSTIQKLTCALWKLSKPNATDIARLYSAHEEKHGFKGMLGSIDCMQWAWKNYPVAWKGQYTRGDHGHPTIMLEAVASYDMLIWHAFFGMAGSNNYINVLNHSPLFDSLRKDRAAPSPFEVNGNQYLFGYYLADGIYPDWKTLIQGYTTPIEEPRKKFTKFQSSARKDVERTFGVLQGRFAILKTPARVMSVNKMRRIMYSCIVMHNMIQEDNGFTLSTWEQEWLDKPENRPCRNIRRRVKDRRSREKEIRDRDVHNQLREDLTAHIWNLPPNFRSMHN